MSKLATLLDLLLDLGCGTQTVFWVDRFPDGEAVFRSWASAHSADVFVFESAVSITLTRNSNCSEIATFRKDGIQVAAAEAAQARAVCS